MTTSQLGARKTVAEAIPAGIVEALRGKMRGPVALPGEDGYEAARTIWNAMIDRSPALVARCIGRCRRDQRG